MWIVGTDCRDGMRMALPMITATMVLDMENYRGRLKEKIAETHRSMQEHNQMETVPLPDFLKQITGLEKGPEIPDEVKDQWAKHSGNQLETLASMLAAEIVVIIEGENYPLRHIEVASSWEEVLAARVMG